MEENKLEDTYNSRNIITRIYFRTKIFRAIRLAKLKKDDVILDFGCGGGWLERKLKNYEIYGYDVNPKKTKIKNYKKIEPTKIFVLDVFEHIPLSEIENIIKNFKKLNYEFDLIVSLPSENWISRKIRKFVGKPEIPKEHITKHYEITKLLNKHFKLIKKINFLSISYIYLYKHQKINAYL